MHENHEIFSMESFTVNREDSTEGKWYIHIVYNETPANGERMVNCYGAAVVRPDDESEYYFNYSFYHTPDWCKVSGMTLKPVKSYKLSMEEVKKIAGDIFYNIKSFVTKMN